jgi:hypothetical protein
MVTNQNANYTKCCTDPGLWTIDHLLTATHGFSDLVGLQTLDNEIDRSGFALAVIESLLKRYRACPRPSS